LSVRMPPPRVDDPLTISWSAKTGEDASAKKCAVMLNRMQPFKGEPRESINMWLAQLNELLSDSGYSATQRKTILMALLGERPTAHVMATLFRGLNEVQYQMVTYEQIKEELLREYGSAMVLASVKLALEERVQRPGESDVDYIEDLIQMHALAYPSVSQSVIVDMILSKFRRTALDKELVYATKLMFSDEKYIHNPPSLQEIKQRVSVMSTTAQVAKAKENTVTPYGSGVGPSTPQAPWKSPQQSNQSSGHSSNLAQALHNRLYKSPNSSGCWKCGDLNHYTASCPNGKVMKASAEEHAEQF